MERLRAHLGVDRWLLFGGSWGSTLALAYAQAYPERCLGLVLRGIFLARPAEIEWFMEGMRVVFPEAWREFAAFLPASERADLLGSYYRRLNDPDPAVHLPAAQAWDRYEGACVALLPDALPPRADESAARVARDRPHRGALLRQPRLPCRRRTARSRSTASATCRARSSRDATTSSARRSPPTRSRSAWPEAEYIVVPDAGHSMREPGIARELVAAVERMRVRLADGAATGR